MKIRYLFALGASFAMSAVALAEGNKLKLEQTIAKLKARNIFGEIKNTVTEGSKKDLKMNEELA